MGAKHEKSTVGIVGALAISADNQLKRPAENEQLT
jgi:hypothetical protein